MNLDVLSRKKTITSMLRQPQAVKERWVPSAQKRMPAFKKHLHKVHLGFFGRERRFLLIIHLTECYPLS